MGTAKKILLLSSPRPDSDKTPFHFGDGRPPLGLGYLAEFVRANGHDARIADPYHFGDGKIGKIITINSEVKTLDYKVDIFKEIDSYNPDFVGFYVGIISYYMVKDLINSIREKYPNIELVAGGPYISTCPEAFADYFDYSVIGEGEYALLDILNGNSKKGIIKGITISDLDSVPMPNYSDFYDKPYNWKMKIFDTLLKKTYTINSTRGCPFKCRFCCVGNRKFRSICPIKLVNYIEQLQDKYKVDSIYFREDNFTVNNHRVEEFCHLLIKRNLNIKWSCETRVKNLNSNLIELMAKSGYIGAYIGVESGSDRMLQHMRKDETTKDFLEKFPILHSNGIKTYTTWIYNLPAETKADRKMSKDLVEKLNPNFVDNMVFLAIPGSDFYDEINKSKEYEYKENSGVIYYNGFLDVSKVVWNDDRCKYVEELYEQNGVIAKRVDF